MFPETSAAEAARPFEARTFRHRFRLWAAAALGLAGSAFIAESASANDVTLGAQLAQQWCIDCHVLPGQPTQTALQGPPSFREIARSGKTSNQLRIFLLQPHGAMPPLTLSRSEIDALIGYIETLR